MPLSATWTDLEMITGNDGRQIEKDKMSMTSLMHEIWKPIQTNSSTKEDVYDIPYVWNLKTDTKEFIYKTGTDSWNSRTNFQLPKGKGGQNEW